MKSYTKKEHDYWVDEVKSIYIKVRSHKDPYNIKFLNLKIAVYPSVFSPKYFNNTKWYAENLPLIIGKKSLLEIGTGTGAIAIYCSKKGSYVVATDINKEAVKCTQYNALNNNCNFPIFKGDVFKCLPKDTKFDFIFWNHPYNNSIDKMNDKLLIAGFDYNYNSLRSYISNAHLFLKNPNFGLLLGTGGQADVCTIDIIAKDNGYMLELLKYIEMPLSTDSKAPNDFRIYELKKKK
jgi:methylase of polypeptide subunit release factors